MATKRVPALMLAGCQAFLLGGMMSLAIAAAEAANLYGDRTGSSLATRRRIRTRTTPGAYGMGPGLGWDPAWGPGAWDGTRNGARRPGHGLDREWDPAARAWDREWVPGQGMGTPSEGGGQPMGPGFGAPGYGMHPGGQHHGMMGGPRGGYPMAKFNAIGAIDLTDEQRGKFDALRKELNTSVQEIMGKIRAENEKMRKLREEQMRLGKTLSDLKGQMMQATRDVANRAEELLTDDQRKATIDQGRPTMMQPRSVPYAEPQGGATE